VGADTALQWPVGIGAKGNEGVANMAKQTDGAIGYVEFAYAKQNNMTFTQLVNKAGKTVQPSLDSFSAAAAGADWANTPGFNLVLTNQAAPDAWPIVGASFIIVYKRPADPPALLTALKFFDWAFKSGGDMAKQLDYVPLPPNVVQVIEKSWSDNIKGGGGGVMWQ